MKYPRYGTSWTPVPWRPFYGLAKNYAVTPRSTFIAFELGICMTLTIFICSTWAQHASVQMLHRSDSGGITQLRGGVWPNLQRFTLFTDSDSRSTAGITSSLSGNWPFLQEFCSFDVVLDKAAMLALTAIKWPQLKTLHINPFDDAMPEVMRGYRPQLRDLSIGFDLHDEALTHLCQIPWSTVERLQLTMCKHSHYCTDCLVQAYLPNLQELFLVYLSQESGLTEEGMFSCLDRATCTGQVAFARSA